MNAHKQVHYSHIRTLERKIDRIKLMHRLGKLTNEAARKEVRELEKELREKVKKLPPYERSVYNIKKEFGREF